MHSLRQQATEDEIQEMINQVDIDGKSHNFFKYFHLFEGFQMQESHSSKYNGMAMFRTP